MRGEVLGGDGRKRSGADVERDPGDADAVGFERGEERRVEVQSRCRRGDGAGRAREDRLVARLVVDFRRARDVWRQRNGAVTIQIVEERHVARQAQFEKAIASSDDGGARAARKRELAADFRRMADAQLEERAIGSEQALEQQLGFAPGRLRRLEARLDDSRVVQHDEVAGRDESRQIGEREIGERGAIDVQQPAARALGRGHLRDQLARQVVVEVGEPQRRHGHRTVPLLDSGHAFVRRRRAVGRQQTARARRVRDCAIVVTVGHETDHRQAVIGHRRGICRNHFVSR